MEMLIETELRGCDSDLCLPTPYLFKPSRMPDKAVEHGTD